MKIAVGISGGVDSAVAAWRLLQEGHNVFGVFMINWHETEGTLSGDCPWEDDLMYAKLVCKKLGITLEVVDLSSEYRSRIADYMFAEYEAGRTPNPDVLCNREIKWDVFAEKAIELGAEKVATGHYCQIDSVDIRLLRGADHRKDQSYFLCQTTRGQLSKALFPIGHLNKSEVREIAERENLAPFDRKDSQGLCFIGKIDLPTFLKQKLQSKEGDVVEIPRDKASEIKAEHLNEANGNLELLSQSYKLAPSMGKKLGKHQGAHFYTIGQRKGLAIGGTELPIYVISTDISSNMVYVGQGSDHPLLLKDTIRLDADTKNLISPNSYNPDFIFDGVIRYRQEPEKMRVVEEGSHLYAIFDKPQKGVASGQFCAWYDGDELVGSAVIA
ncbi:MAG: tRNA 2-thiouridine(34) synthase MnmA [Candidatus Kapaibacteriales bacterium]